MHFDGAHFVPSDVARPEMAKVKAERDDLAKRLAEINRELGITTIVNLHFLDLATRYADRIIGLRAGELVFDGPGSDADEQVFRDIYGRSLTADDVMGAEDEPEQAAL